MIFAEEVLGSLVMPLTITAKTCSEIKSHYPQATSGSYIIDPDGERGGEPFTVFCDMTDKNGVGVTIVSHDSKERVYVKGYEAKGSYQQFVQYSGAGLTSVKQLTNLADIDSHCEQFIKYECYGSLLLNNGDSQGWWVSRDLVRMAYWGGATPADSFKCACGVTKTCSDATDGCNCDKNDAVWREDSGYLMEKTDLPVLQLRLGDTGGMKEKGYHREFKCYGMN